MADPKSAAVEGLPQLLDRLQSIDKKVRKKVLGKATRAAGKVVVTGARQKVRVETGLLKKALGTKARSYRSGAVAVVMVGPRSAFVMKKDKATGTRTKVATKFGGLVSRGGRKEVYARPSKYSHLVEKGTRRSRAFPFLGPSATPDATARMAEVIAQGIEDAGNGR